MLWYLSKILAGEIDEILRKFWTASFYKLRTKTLEYVGNRKDTFWVFLPIKEISTDGCERRYRVPEEYKDILVNEIW